MIFRKLNCTAQCTYFEIEQVTKKNDELFKNACRLCIVIIRFINQNTLRRFTHAGLVSLLEAYLFRLQFSYGLNWNFLNTFEGTISIFSQSIAVLWQYVQNNTQDWALICIHQLITYKYKLITAPLPSGRI